ncbi:MAG: hypothetical protein IKF99_17625 [Oscillospiraceae bacterium]|nr:hypothetical protein [Oscillospiraceae bacterium]
MSEKSLWDGLKALGLPDLGAAVTVGHGKAESGNECNRLQGDFELSRSWSRTYTSMVDSEEVSRDDFIFRGPGGGGYGWLQWTYRPRKAGYYDNAKKLGVSIGSEEAALSWFWEELHQPGFSGVLQALMEGTDLRKVSDVFLDVFERPAVVDLKYTDPAKYEAAAAQRAAFCQEMLDKYGGSAPDKPAEGETWDFAVAVLQCCMVNDGYLDRDKITGAKSPEFRALIKKYAADVAAT